MNATTTTCAALMVSAMLAAPAAAQDVRRPSLLPALYAGSVTLQAYDAYSTLTLLKQGAVEANPVMRGLVKSPPAFIAMKVGVSAASIAMSERLWRDHHRVAAVVTMVATNTFMGVVAAHNAGVRR